MATWLRGPLRGAAFGLLAGTVNLWLGMVVVVQRRLSVGPTFHAKTLALEIALGALLGLAASPLLRVRAGRVLHGIAVALLWIALEKWVELDSPIFKTLQYAPPLLGLLLLAIGSWLAARRVGIAVATAVVLVAGGLAAPDLYLTLTTPPVAEKGELPPASPGAPDVVLVVLDTVRAQNLASYGYERATSPVLDALAREGVLFEDATSPSTWSLPSHASLFTGRFPSGHGAHAESRVLGDTLPTLAESLSLAGYETNCFTSNPWISDPLGLTRGFQHQDLHWRSGGDGGGRLFGFIYRLLAKLGVETPDKGGGVIADHFERWVRERPGEGRPYFAFLNFIEAHFPHHQLPESYLTRFTERSRRELREVSLELLAAQFGGSVADLETAMRDARDMYDGGVLYSDYLLGRVVDAIRERGTLDRTVFVMLADHGELLGEKEGYFGHGPSLYQPMIGVPLYLRYPPRVPSGVRVPTPVSTVGVYATILDLVGVAPPPTLHVASLLPVIDGTGAPGPVLAERFKATGMGAVDREGDGPMMRAGLRYRAFRSGPWKLVEDSSGRFLLYDLKSDPQEQRDLSEDEPAQLASLRAALAESVAALDLPALDAELGAGAEAELDAETRERLKALGYVE